jgi:diaminopimelate epimerase
MALQFLKMHGAGNDFVIFDARKTPVELNPQQLTHIAARQKGVGCDQVIVMGKSKKADVFMRIYNADGSEAATCGNAARCVGWIMMEENENKKSTVETKAGLIHCERIRKDRVRADMGEPKFGWKDIPLSEDRDTLHLRFSLGDLSDPTAVSMGNPHAIFVVGDVARLRIRDIGPQLENYKIFPERANISFAQPVNDGKIKLRVWERGVGETLTCGTAACATLVGLHRRKLAGRKADIVLPGGTLEVEWDKATNHVFMTGPVVLSFSGLLL